MHSILLIDMFNLFTRFFCASPSLDNNGEPSGGIIGTLKSIANMTKTINPKKVICIWESGGSSRRRAIYPQYKLNRKPPKTNRIYENVPDTEENKWKQVVCLTNILKYLPVHQIHIENAEADDVIGYICGLKYPEERKIIVSSDKDFYQLLDDKTVVYNPAKMTYFNKNDVLNEFNITAENFCIAKAISGDDSDNVKGIYGAGFKTVAKRFVMNKEKISIDDIISVSKELKEEKKAPKIYNDICENIDVLHRNYKIMKLDSALLSADQIVSINRILDEYKFKNNKLKYLQKYLEFQLNGVDPESIYNIFSYLYYLNK